MRVDLPRFRRSKNAWLPARAPSRRPGLSTFTTLAPSSPSRCVQSGPAQSAERSTTSGRAPRLSGAARRSQSIANQPGVLLAGKRSAAIASDSNRPRSMRSSTGTADTALATARHPPSVAPLSGPCHFSPRKAGSAPQSWARARVSAIRPSAQSSSWQPPPGETRPLRARPVIAARSASSSPPRGSTPSGVTAIAASASRAPSAQEASGTGHMSGGPSRCPVSAMAPHSAQRRAGCTDGPAGGTETSAPRSRSSFAAQPCASSVRAVGILGIHQSAIRHRDPNRYCRYSN